MPTKKPTSATVPERTRSQQVEQLTEAVTTLTEHVQVLTDALSDIREDLNWITRNGIPGSHPIEHTRLIRMARDPLSPNARDHLELRTYTLEPHGSSPITPEVFNDLVSEIAEAMTVVGQEQLNMFLSALDDARTKLLAAIKSPATTPPKEEPNPTPAAPPQHSVSTRTSPSKPPGHLF